MRSERFGPYDSYDRRKPQPVPAGDDYMTPLLRMLLALHNENEKTKEARRAYEAVLHRAPWMTPEYAARKEEEEQIRLQAALIRARKIKGGKLIAGVKVEKINRWEIYERDNGICHICGEETTVDAFHLDHVYPLSRGGDHTAANLKVSHPLCNIKKGAKLGYC